MTTEARARKKPLVVKRIRSTDNKGKYQEMKLTAIGLYCDRRILRPSVT